MRSNPGDDVVDMPPMRDYAETCRQFRWQVPDTFNFGADVVDAWADDDARPALVWCDAVGAEQRLTFADVARASTRLAAALAAHGVAQGDRVIIMLPRSPHWHIAMTACLKLGAVVVPCISMLTSRDLAYRIAHCGARGIVTTAANVSKVERDAAPTVRVAVGGAPGWPGWLDWDELLAEGDERFAPATVAAEDPVAIYYTSGTSGSPKGVTHAARALYVWRVQARYWLDLAPGDLIWCTADTGWSKAGTSLIFGPWSLGASVLVYDGPFEPTRRLELLERYRVSVFCAAATELRSLVHEDVSRYRLDRLRHTVSAGETLNPEIARRWSELTGAPCREGYGQTESLMSVHNYPSIPARPGSAGLALPGYIVEVLREDGSSAPRGETGILAIRLPNPNLMLGYWGEPERMEQHVVRNAAGAWWSTGDTAYMDADGYVYLLGRGDDVINSAGYRIGPAEVENVLLEHPAVRECAAVASPDPDRGEVVKAFVVLVDATQGAEEDLVRALQEHCKTLTAPYKYPRKITFVEDLPKNAAGKVLRAELRRREFA
ncbi:MAG: AMP-binding protein [Gammaproteobacteria bacterium]|nr:AMP-binding protein [Gammaproteobacteria bacterium]